MLPKKAENAFISFLTNKKLNETFPRNSFALAMELDGKVSVVKYPRQPCYGEMRPYEKTHPEEVKDGVHMPSDLYTGEKREGSYKKFPDGNPVGVCLALRNGKINSFWAGFTEWIFSEKSPWRSVMANVKPVHENDILLGYIWTETDFDPTVLVNAWMTWRFGPGNIVEKLLEKGLSWDIAFFINKQVNLHTLGYEKWRPTIMGDGVLKDNSNVSLWLNGTPLNLTFEGKSFAQRGAYNRPQIMDIFKDGKNKITDMKTFQKYKTEKTTPIEFAVELAKELEDYRG